MYVHACIVTYVASTYVCNTCIYLLLEFKMAIQKSSSAKPSLVTTQESIRHGSSASAVVTSQSIVSSSPTTCVSQPAPLTTSALHTNGKSNYHAHVATYIRICNTSIHSYIYNIS